MSMLTNISRISSVAHVISRQSTRYFCDAQDNFPTNPKALSGLAKALGKFHSAEVEAKKPQVESQVVERKSESFLHLLRNSPFVKLGDPKGKVVVGKIFQVVNTDLYIDYGAKFYCVCRRPVKNAEYYVRGAKVRMRLNETELCARFLGATEDLTLLEGDATLLNLVWSPFNQEGTQKTLPVSQT